MDFRMDKLSWGLLAFMFLTFMYFILSGGTQGAGMGLYLQAILIAALAVVVVVALMSLPVLVYCYFVKMIPDIDYSIRLGAIFTVIGIISEVLF